MEDQKTEDKVLINGRDWFPVKTTKKLCRELQGGVPKRNWIACIPSQKAKP